MAGGNRADCMFVDQLIRFSPEDDAKIIETEDDPLELTTRGQLDRDMVAISPYAIEKLVLNIDLILHDCHLVSPPQE